MLFIIWLFFGCVFAWACAAIAKNKGREPAVWGVLGFLFGIFALIVIAVLSDQRERVGLDGGELRKCPKCAETIKAVAVKCRYCRSDIEPLVPGPATA